jgi:hypothetical protein
MFQDAYQNPFKVKPVQPKKDLDEFLETELLVNSQFADGSRMSRHQQHSSALQPSSKSLLS